MDPAKEKAVAEFEEWLDEANLPQDSGTDLDDFPSLGCPIEVTERRRPAPTLSEATPKAFTQGSSSAQDMATIEAERNRVLADRRIYYFNLLTQLSTMDVAAMFPRQKEAHGDQIIWLCTKLGIPKS